MKKFNLDKAKKGAPICTRDGKNARIICTDAKGDYPVIALIEESNSNYEWPMAYCENGMHFKKGDKDVYDLMMKN